MSSTDPATPQRPNNDVFREHHPTDVAPTTDRNQQAATSLPGSKRRRRRLDRDQVATAGLAHIDEHGLGALSMRAVGARLGVEAMTLYRYTTSKADLLDAVVELLLTQMRAATPQRPLSRGQHWRSRLREVAHAVRGTALAHPSAFGLLASYTPPQAWLRPPLCDPTWAVCILHDLQAAGLDETTALGAYYDLAGFLLGHLLPEAARDAATATTGAMRDGIRFPAQDSVDPRAERSASLTNPAEQFESSLRRFMDHLPLSSPHR